MRNDLEDADDEELEDKVVEAYRSKRKPLGYEEINRLSRGNLDSQNFDMSILSGILKEQDYHELS